MQKKKTILPRGIYNYTGFSLIEMLIACFIMALLTTSTMRVFRSSVKKNDAPLHQACNILKTISHQALYRGYIIQTRITRTSISFWKASRLYLDQWDKIDAPPLTTIEWSDSDLLVNNQTVNQYEFLIFPDASIQDFSVMIKWAPSSFFTISGNKIGQIICQKN